MTSAFSKNLRRLRERRGIKRKVLSELCGLSKNMISRYERGERVPPSDVLEQLADFFGVTMGELWGQEKK